MEALGYIFAAVVAAVLAWLGKGEVEKRKTAKKEARAAKVDALAAEAKASKELDEFEEDLVREIVDANSDDAASDILRRWRANKAAVDGSPPGETDPS